MTLIQYAHYRDAAKWLCVRKGTGVGVQLTAGDGAIRFFLFLGLVDVLVQIPIRWGAR